MFWSKLKGEGASRPPRPAWRSILLGGAGGALTILLLGHIGQWGHWSLLLGSFGATCVLVFGYPDLPFSQPRHVLAGHVLSSLVGLLCLHLLGPSLWAAALAVALAIMLMMVLNVVHPPAGSNPVIVFLTQPGWSFLLTPTAAGAALLLVLAVLYHNLTRKAAYPKYW
ncbi:HPP family protein [Leeia sp.]|uniref:HPP family protein n=1 Tax=Leeia sp. TaxID=2884678 RepID=UPI0035B2A74C